MHSFAKTYRTGFSGYRRNNKKSEQEQINGLIEMPYLPGFTWINMTDARIQHGR
jgi:hypothetical protein